MEHFASVKKQSGKLNVGAAAIEWLPANGGKIPISFDKITGMKATPPTAAVPRILLTGENNSTVLKVDFSSREALEAARDDIQKAIQAFRNQQSAVTAKEAAEPAQLPAQTTSGTGEPAAAKPAAPKSGKTGKKKALSLDTDRLLQNLVLQRKVLESDESLRKLFQEVVMSGSLSNEQFWSTRIDLLVTEAQSQSQARGAYNVLSTVKPKTGSDSKINLSLTREKIKDIFDQYPIVRKAYNENVPEISESEFWQRFFMSQLFLTLRGEKISRNHPYDSIIDRYINILHESMKRQTQQETHLPLYLDVGANDADVPGRSSNPLDMTMKFSLAKQSVPSLIKSMNGLSEQLLRGKLPKKAAAATKRSSATDDAEMDEQIRLRDLQLAPKQDEGIDLHVQPSLVPAAEDEVMDVYVDPKQFSHKLRLPLDLGDEIQGEEIILKSVPAMEKVNGLIVERASHQENSESGGTSIDNEELLFAHATTLEFLSHFWKAKLSSAPLEPFGPILDKSLLRLQRVIEQSEPAGEQLTAALEPILASLQLAKSLVAEAH